MSFLRELQSIRDYETRLRDDDIDDESSSRRLGESYKVLIWVMVIMIVTCGVFRVCLYVTSRWDNNAEDEYNPEDPYARRRKYSRRLQIEYQLTDSRAILEAKHFPSLSSDEEAGIKKDASAAATNGSTAFSTASTEEVLSASFSSLEGENHPHGAEGNIAEAGLSDSSMEDEENTFESGDTRPASDVELAIVPPRPPQSTSRTTLFVIGDDLSISGHEQEDTFIVIEQHQQEDARTTDKNNDEQQSPRCPGVIKRTFPNQCAICLSSYKVNQTIVWSPANVTCSHSHAYHEDCIKQVLQRDTKCPMCRQDFVVLG